MPKSIREIETTCFVRLKLNLSCNNCQYQGIDCERFKEFYNIERPSDITCLHESGHKSFVRPTSKTKGGYHNGIKR